MTDPLAHLRGFTIPAALLDHVCGWPVCDRCPTAAESAQECASSAPPARHPGNPEIDAQRPDAPRGDGVRPVLGCSSPAGPSVLVLVDEVPAAAWQRFIEQWAADASSALVQLGEHVVAAWAPVLDEVRRLAEQRPDLFGDLPPEPTPMQAAIEAKRHRNTGPAPRPLDGRRRRR